MIKVILCTYNGERFLKEQIRSLLNQTEQDLKIIISDDASKDLSPEIIHRFAKEYPDKIEFTEQRTPSGGACAHFLKVLYQCGSDADYVMFSDQDDVWDPDKTEKTLEAMKKAEGQYGKDTPLLVHCDSRITDAEGNVIADSYVRYQKMSPERNGLNRLLVQNNVTGAAAMLNAALVRLILSCPAPEHAVMHDHWIALCAAAFGHVVFLNQALYGYRQHEDNDLGAAKGSRIREILDRLGIGRKDSKTKTDMDLHSKEVYTALFRQAAEFYRIYKDRLSRSQKQMLHAFVTMKDLSRQEKILMIFRYGFTFNKLHRTIGECIFL